MAQSKSIKLMARGFRLDDLRKAIINELEAFQGKRRIFRITHDDVDKVMKIIQKKGAGEIKIKGTHGNSARAKYRTFADFYFVHRKGIIAMYVFLDIEEVKEGKKFSVQRINDIHYLFRFSPFDVLMYLIYKDRLSEIKYYLSRRQIRECLRKANECGIDVSDIKEDVVISADFKNPCLLLILIIDKERGNRQKRLLYTPYGKFEYKGKAINAHLAFKGITGARRVPYGKDAMKKIEALLIQASI